MRSRGQNNWPVGDSLSLRVPVVQAPLGACDGPRLAAEVSRAGALGCLTVHGTPPNFLRHRVAKIRNRTRHPVLIAFTSQSQHASVLETCLVNGFLHYQVFWWNGPRLTRRIHAGGGTALWQVGSPEQAAEALDCGADILIAQGTEAGGQVRSPLPVMELIEALREMTADTVPIIAGGGLANAADVSRVLTAGASAALLGTRFLLTEESRASDRCKQRLLRANSDDLFLDTRLIGDWPCAPRRRLLTARDVDRTDLFAGLGISQINALAPAFEVVRSLIPLS